MDKFVRLVPWDGDGPETLLPRVMKSRENAHPKQGGEFLSSMSRILSHGNKEEYLGYWVDIVETLSLGAFWKSLQFRYGDTLPGLGSTETGGWRVTSFSPA